MNLEKFMFPVVERPVAVAANGQTLSLTQAEEYKALVREDTGDIISIVRNSYQLVPNGVLIERLLDELSASDTPFRIDPSHSFVNSARMRLQITFPEVTIRDADSDIALSLFVSNSYDQSEGVRVFFGAIRAICSNGMVFGKVLAKFYGRHTSGFSVDNLRERLGIAYDALPTIQQRIQALEAAPVTMGLAETVETELGKRMAEAVLQPVPPSQWALYNAITHRISHDMEQRHRARYQLALSRVFEL